MSHLVKGIPLPSMKMRHENAPNVLTTIYLVWDTGYLRGAAVEPGLFCPPAGHRGKGQSSRRQDEHESIQYRYTYTDIDYRGKAGAILSIQVQIGLVFLLYKSKKCAFEVHSP